MKREPVDSEVLRSIGYDPDTGVLELEFDGGTVYRYFDVPARLYAGLMTARSHGEFFSDYIRNAGFDYLQVSPPPGHDD
ncbi:KTSC domain-containing protein [Lysobacter cavernae]|uniref:KTSC domain-containing protein n=1 Tax=Lysobacter cavernae TaxID=1685901 RepID=A0ABV7RLV0_9GAMM